HRRGGLRPAAVPEEEKRVSHGSRQKKDFTTEDTESTEKRPDLPCCLPSVLSVSSVVKSFFCLDPCLSVAHSLFSLLLPCYNQGWLGWANFMLAVTPPFVFVGERGTPGRSKNEGQGVVGTP